MSLKRRLYLCAEFLVLFAGIPLLIMWSENRSLMFGALWAAALCVLGYMKIRINGFTHLKEWNYEAALRGMPHVLIRFVIAAPLLTVFTWLAAPDALFRFPLEMTRLWLGVMFLYPILSVWPQEIIYRSFIFKRYNGVIAHKYGLLVLSALSFGFVHILFENAIALVLSTLGGFLFARTYYQTKSLALVCFEHALYGCLIFTIGLGIYFYSGANWSH